ncbi:MAG: bifunctional methylenetetrahydrofolate dehydrogenase/methenyltetrahydrofolate cyclohydrolase FolD [Anaerolineales bacterium]|nr:bifunctional methylenetetrahydrofolate dehydrogenase/methenyltetrahydrofolate cyclohydrolase FolD [Anaerolineales bacterium]
MATLIDGKSVAEHVRADVKELVAAMKAETGRVPCLATVLVGDDPASHFYVRSKHKSCLEVGMETQSYELPATTSQAEVEALVQKLTDDDEVDGILVQLPLPDGLVATRVIDLIDPVKDVDGLHLHNLGGLAARGRDAYVVPATPLGIMTLLKETGVEISGKRAVVVGRSSLVGMPIALLLLNANATVTVCHSRTQELTAHLKEADIVVVAIGRPNYVSGDQLKPGCVVIDVGINKVDDATRKRGYRLVGDVEFESAEKVAGYITPVPGGVGPMTIASLLHNTVTAAKRRDELKAGAPA